MSELPFSQDSTSHLSGVVGLYMLPPVRQPVPGRLRDAGTLIYVMWVEYQSLDLVAFR